MANRSSSKLTSVFIEILDILFSALPVIFAVVMIILHRLREPIPQSATNDEVMTVSIQILTVLIFIGVKGLWDKYRTTRQLIQNVEATKSQVDNNSAEITRLENKFSTFDSRIDALQQEVRQINAIIDERIKRRVTTDDIFHRSMRPTIDFFRTANVVHISGITLGNTINKDIIDVLQDRLRHGAHIKIIILDRSSKEALNQLVKRSYGDVTVETYQGRLANTLTQIQIIGRVPGATGQLEVGHLPFVPSFGPILIDPITATGRAYVELYHHKKTGSAPEFYLGKDESWFEFFNEQFELMWKECKIETLTIARN